MAARRFVKPLLLVAIPVAAIVALVAFWNWDWFIPIVEGRASSTLGRRLTIEHLHVQFGRLTTVSADNVRIANPADFPEQGDFARIPRLNLQADVMAYIRSREIVLPEIVLERPQVQALQTADEKNNYTLALGGESAVKIGHLRISDGQAHVVIPALKADFALRIATREAPATAPGAATPDSQIVVDAKGTYAGQRITGQLVGGALLSLREPQHPYPVRLKLVNGATRVSLAGTLTDPLTFGGADLKLELSGADMRDLYHLTGIPIPQTPAYRIAGQLDYADAKFRFHVVQGAAAHIAHRRARPRRGADPYAALGTYPAGRHTPAAGRALDPLRLALNQSEGLIREHAAEREGAASHALAIGAVTGVDHDRRLGDLVAVSSAEAANAFALSSHRSAGG
jgi:hypothetical protein